MKKSLMVFIYCLTLFAITLSGSNVYSASKYETEPNENKSSATSVNFGDKIVGNMWHALDYDWYSISGVPEGLVSLTAYYEFPSGATADTQVLYVEIRDKDNKVLSDFFIDYKDYTKNTPYIRDIKIPSSNTYYIVVHCPSQAKFKRDRYYLTMAKGGGENATISVAYADGAVLNEEGTVSVKVDEALKDPIIALVRDENGKAIEGAPVVFSIIAGSQSDSGTTTDDSKTFSGNGNNTTDVFEITSGIKEFTYNYEGERYFAVYLVNMQTLSKRVLYSTIGKAVNEKTAETFTGTGNYFLEVNVNDNASWKLTVQNKADTSSTTTTTSPTIIGTVSTTSDGKAEYKYKATDKKGDFTIIVSFGNSSDKLVIKQTAGSPAKVNIVDLVADPDKDLLYINREYTLNVTVLDKNNNLVEDDTEINLSGISNSTAKTKNGMAKFTISASTAKEYTLTASVKGTSSIYDTLKVKFNDITLSNMMAQPAYILADGKNTSTISVRLSDSNGMAVIGEPITFTTTCGTLLTGSAKTDDKGVAQVTLVAPFKAGTCTVTAAYGTVNLTAPVEFYGDGTGSTTASILLETESKTVSANGKNSVVLTATLTDSAGEPVAAGTPIEFTTDKGIFPNGTKIFKGSTPAGGKVKVALLSQLGEVGKANITCSSGGVKQSVQVTFIAVTGDGSPVGESTANIKLTASPTTIAADGKSSLMITAELFDSTNKPVPAGTSIIFYAAKGQFANRLLEFTAATTDDAGKVYVALISAALTNTESVDIWCKSDDVYQLTTVTFKGSNPTPNVGTITLSANPTTIPADGASSSSITAEVKDTSGNPVPKGTSIKFDTNIGTFSNKTGTITVKTSDDAGKIIVPLIASKTAGYAQVTATSGGASQSTLVTFESTTQPVPTTAYIELTANPDKIPADGKSSLMVSATLYDSTGKPMPKGTSATFSASHGKFVNSSVTTADDSGKVSVSLISSTTSGSVDVTCKSSNGITQLIQVYFTGSDSGIGSTASIGLSASPTTIPADGASSLTITITLKDATGAPVVMGTSATLSITPATIGTLSKTTVTTVDDTGVISVSLKSGNESGTARIVCSSNNITQATTVTFTGGSSDTKIPAFLSLALSQLSVKTDNSDSTEITATVLDSKYAVIKGVPVSFSSDGGQLSSPLVDTDDKGLAKITFSSGTIDKSNRLVTVTAKISSLSAYKIPVQIVGSTLDIETQKSLILDDPVTTDVDESTKVDLTIKALDAGGTSVYNAKIEIKLMDPAVGKTGKVEWIEKDPKYKTTTANQYVTDINGEVKLTVSGKTAGDADISITGLGATEIQTYTVISDPKKSFNIVIPNKETITAITHGDTNLAFISKSQAISFQDNGFKDQTDADGKPIKTVISDTITRSDAGSFKDEDNKFEAGDQIMVAGSINNDGVYTVASVSEKVLTLNDSAALTPEDESTDITITNAPSSTVVVKVRAPNQTKVRFATTMGKIDNENLQIKDIDKIKEKGGFAYVVIHSKDAGVATVSASDYDNSEIQDLVSIVFSRPIKDASSIVLKSNTSIVSPTTESNKSSAAVKAELTAVVRSSAANGNQPIAGVPVIFTIENVTGSGETVSPVIAYTDASGQAYSTFTSGFQSSNAEGITVQARVVGSATTGEIKGFNFELPDTIKRTDEGSFKDDGFVANQQIRVRGSVLNDKDFNVIAVADKILTLHTDDILTREESKESLVITALVNSTTIVVGGTSGSVVIGRGGDSDIKEVNNKTAYSLPMSVLVADLNGNPVSGAKVSLSLWPERYKTGINYGSDIYISGTFPNEDKNQNTVLDPGEDVDKDGSLTPSNSAAGQIPISVTTTADGIAEFNLVYLKSSAYWIDAKITATTMVFGTEATSTTTFSLPSNTSIPDSPYILRLIAKSGEKTDKFSLSIITLTMVDADGDIYFVPVNFTNDLTSVATCELSSDKDYYEYQFDDSRTKNGKSEVGAIYHDYINGDKYNKKMPIDIFIDSPDSQPGSPVKIELESAPPSGVLATSSGASKSIVTAYVKDSNGYPVDDNTPVKFTITNKLGYFKDSDGNSVTEISTKTTGGKASVEYIAGSAKGTEIIKVSSIGEANATIEKTINIEVIEASVDTVKMTPEAELKAEITADGKSDIKVSAKVTVKDTEGNSVLMDGLTVTFTTNAGNFLNADGKPVLSIEATTTNGIAEVRLISSKTVGRASVIAKCNGVFDSTEITFIPGPVSKIVLTANPDTLTADGKSTSTITALVTDINGNAVKYGETINFSIPEGGGILTTLTGITQNGYATVEYTAPNNVPATGGTVTVTAKGTNDSITNTTTITLIPTDKTPVFLTLGLSQISVKTDNSDKTIITATVLDKDSAVVEDIPVYFSASYTDEDGNVTSGGELSASLVRTNEKGQAVVEFSSGTIDKSNRTVNITAKTFKTDIKGMIPVRVIGSKLDIVTENSLLMNDPSTTEDESTTVPLTITALDAGGNPVYNTSIIIKSVIENNVKGEVLWTPEGKKTPEGSQEYTTDINGKVTLTVSGKEAGEAKIDIAGLGVTQTQNYTVVGEVAKSFGIVMPVDDLVTAKTRDNTDLALISASKNISFKDNEPLADTITRSDGSFIDDKFKVGDQIMLAGSANNDGIYKVSNISPDGKILTLNNSVKLTDEPEGAEITITNSAIVKVRAPTPINKVLFATTIGTMKKLNAADPEELEDMQLKVVKVVNGFAFVVVHSSDAGLATISASDYDNSDTNDTVNIAFSRPVADAASVVLKTSTAILSQSTVDSKPTAKLTAVVRTSAETGSQPVGGVPVIFTIENATGSGETLSPVVAYTDSAGEASTTFTSGSQSSDGEGVTIQARVVGSATTREIQDIEFINPNTIERKDGVEGSFIKDGFIANQKVRISGSVSNDGYYTVTNISEKAITLHQNDVLTEEPIVKSLEEITFAAPNMIVRGIGSFIEDGFKNSQYIKIEDAGDNNGFYIISNVLEKSMVLKPYNTSKQIVAKAQKATVKISQTPPVTITALAHSISIIIGGTSGSVVIGRATSDKIESINSDTTYSLPMTVLVADLNGNPVSGAKVSLNLWPEHYRTGVWYKDSDVARSYISGFFPNEDTNQNTVLDPGEDTNKDGMLTPPNSAAGTIPTEVPTDANGNAVFNMIYPKSSAEWISVRISATTKVFGTETTSTTSFILPARSVDIKADSLVLPDSPYILTLKALSEGKTPGYKLTSFPYSVRETVKDYDDNGKVIGERIITTQEYTNFTNILPNASITQNAQDQRIFIYQYDDSSEKSAVGSIYNDIINTQVPLKSDSDQNSSILVNISFPISTVIVSGTDSQKTGEITLLSEFASIAADGKSQTTVTATVKSDKGVPVDNKKVIFSTSNGTLSSTTAFTNNQGVAKVTLTSSNTSGFAAITAKSDDITSSPIKIEFLKIGKITLSSEPESLKSIAADGKSQITITATVQSDQDVLINNKEVTFLTSKGTLSSTTALTNDKGVAKVTLTSSNASGLATITAKSDDITSSPIEIKFLGTPEKIELTVDKQTLPADGKSTAIITASVLDSSGYPVPDNTEITFTLTGSGVFKQGGQTTTVKTKDGKATAEYITSSNIGTEVITVSTGQVKSVVNVELIRFVGKIELAVEPPSIPADGKSSTSITATITDTTGNLIGKDIDVKFETNLGKFSTKTAADGTTIEDIKTITVKTPDDSGKVTIPLIAGVLPGTATVTVTVGSVSQSTTVSFVGTEDNSAKAKYLSLSSSQNSIKSDNSDQTEITATVLDINRVPLQNVKVVFATQAGVKTGLATNETTTVGQLSSSSANTDKDGKATVKLSSGPEKKNQTITVTAFIPIINPKPDSDPATDDKYMVEVKSIPIIVTGTTLTLDPGKYTSLEINDDPTKSTITTLTITAKDAGGNPIQDGDITISIDKTTATNLGIVEITPLTDKTDSYGQLKVNIKGISVGDTIIKVDGLGDTKTQKYSIYKPGDALRITTPEKDSVDLAIDEELTLIVHVPPLTAPTTIRFVSTLGMFRESTGTSWSQSLDIKDKNNEEIEVYFKSDSAGIASIYVVALNSENPEDFTQSDSITATIAASADKATQIALQASPIIVAPSSGDVQNVSNLTATVKNETDQPVANAVVVFSILNPVGGGEKIEPVLVPTGSSGIATTKFTSGSMPSGGSGIKLLARVIKSDAGFTGPVSKISFNSASNSIVRSDEGSFIDDRFQIGSKIRIFGSTDAKNDKEFFVKSITAKEIIVTSTSDNLIDQTEGAKIVIGSMVDDVNIVIGGTPGSIVIGSSTVVTSNATNTHYTLPMSVLVSDAGGHPVVKQEVSLNIWPVKYYKGGWLKGSPYYDGAGIYNEDINRNNILDLGEDKNGDKTITPLNSSAGSLPRTVITDDKGVANFELVYLKNYAVWIDAEISASTIVSGTETVSQLVFTLPYYVFDSSYLPPSPFNIEEKIYDVKYLSLSSSKNSVKSDNSEQSTVTATVLDEKRVPLANIHVVFTTTAGQLSASSDYTDANGNASVIFSSGIDKTNQTATVSVSIPGVVVTDPPLKYPTTNIEITGTTLTLEPGDYTKLDINDHDTSTLTVTAKDGGGIAIADADIVISILNQLPASLPNIVEFTPATGKTDANGQLKVQIKGKSDGNVTIQAEGLGFKATQQYYVYSSSVPAKINLKAEPESLPTDGKSISKITASVLDGNGNPVADNTPITLTIKGEGKFKDGKGQSVDTISSKTKNGDVSVEFIASSKPGVATITASTTNGVSGTVDVELVGAPTPEELYLSFSQNFVKSDNSDKTEITATVLDNNRAPIDNVTVNFTTRTDEKNADGTFKTAGQLSISSVKTDPFGKASVFFSSGPERKNQIVYIVATIIVNSTTPSLNKTEEIPITISGSTLTVDPGDTSLEINTVDASKTTVTTLTVMAKDAGGNPIQGADINISKDTTSELDTGYVQFASTTDKFTGKTDYSGKLEVDVKGVSQGNVTIKVEGLGLTINTTKYSVYTTGDALRIIDPIDNNITLDINEEKQIKVHVPLLTAPTTIRFASTLGVFSKDTGAGATDTGAGATWNQSLDIPDVNDKDIEVYFKSDTAGMASIYVVALNSENPEDFTQSDSITATIAASADDATQISLQATPLIVAPSSGGVVNISDLTATVKNNNDQPVANAVVLFSMLNPVGGGEKIDPVMVTTGSSGIAKTTFTSGSIHSSGNGIKILARVIKSGSGFTGPISTIKFDATTKSILRSDSASFITDGFKPGDKISIFGSTNAQNDKNFTIESKPTIESVTAEKIIVKSDLITEDAGARIVIGSIIDDVNIVIGGTPSSIVIGQSTTITADTTNTNYILPMSIQVSDAGGHPVANQKVSLNIWPYRYYKGWWKDYNFVYDGAAINNEDINRNNILDSLEDINGDGRITPPNSSAGTIPATVTTNEYGVADFKLIYLKSYAVWIEAEIRASTVVSGTETVSKLIFTLPYIEAESDFLSPSPFNSTQDITPTYLSLTASKNSVKSDNSDSSIITAYVLDSNFVPVNNIKVTFEIKLDGGKGELSSASALTVNGKATVNFSSGINKKNEQITITASFKDNTDEDDKEVFVNITGTTLTLDTGVYATLEVNKDTILTITAKDAGGNLILNSDDTISISSFGNPEGVVTITPLTVGATVDPLTNNITCKTDKNGQFQATIKGVSAGKVTIRAEGFGDTKTKDYEIYNSGSSLTIKDPTSDDKPNNLSINETLKITVSVPAPPATNDISFISTLGEFSKTSTGPWTPQLSLGNVSGDKTVYFRSGVAGTASIYVVNLKNFNENDNITATISASSTDATQISLQASPTIVAPSSGSTVNFSNLTATVKNDKDQPVKGAMVIFSIINPVGGGEKIDPTYGWVETDSSGIATSKFISGTVASDSEGIQVRAIVNTTTGTIEDTINIIIGGTPGSIGIGRSTKMKSDETNTYYILPMTIIVSDAGGHPVANQTVSLKNWPVHYRTGRLDKNDDGWYVFNSVWHNNEDINKNNILDTGEDINGNGKLDIDEDINGNNILDTGEDINGNGKLDTDEDINENNILDTGEDINGNGKLDIDEDINGNKILDTGEDINKNGKLDTDEDINKDGKLDTEDLDGDLRITPPNSSCGTVPDIVKTNANGIATFDLYYLKQYGWWIEAEIEASTVVSGTETISQSVFILPILVGDEEFLPSVSPFGN